MAATKDRLLEAGVTVVSFAGDPTGEQWALAFKNKKQWVVGSTPNQTLRYATVLRNLAPEHWRTAATKIEAVRDALNQGLPKSAFDRLKAILATSGEELCDVIGVPARTIARRSTFKPDESERILRVAAAFQRAIEVMGELGKARRWFTSPSRALGGKTPFEFCDTEPGTLEVNNLLGRIEHGVFS